MLQCQADGMHICTCHHVIWAEQDAAQLWVFPSHLVGTILTCTLWLQRSKLSSWGPRSEDLPSSQCLAEALEEQQCFYPAGRKISIRLTCPIQRHFALHPAKTEVLQPPNSTGEGADSSRIAELNPSNSNNGIEGLLQILTITKFRPSGALFQSLRVVELIWKPLY